MTKINGKEFAGSFHIDVKHTNIDHQTTVPVRVAIEGSINISEEDFEFIHGLHINREKFITEGIVNICGVNLPFLGKMMCAELRFPLLSFEGEDEGEAKLTSSGPIYFDFIGIGEKKTLEILEILYA